VDATAAAVERRERSFSCSLAGVTRTLVRVSGPLRSGRKIRVVTLVDTLSSFGGGERLAAEIAMRLDGTRFTRILCVSRPPIPHEPPEATVQRRAAARESGVRIIELNRPWRLALWAWAPLYSLLRNERVDVVHAHKFGSNVWGTLLGRLAGVPVVIGHEHGSALPRESLRRFLERNLIVRGADALVAVSPAVRRDLIEAERVDPSKVVLVPSGIPARPLGSERALRDELGIQPADPVVGAVGGLRPEKGLDVLVEAAAALARRHPRLKVLIAGEGPERGRLQAKIEGLELQETVIMLGIRSDVPDVLAALDVAVLSSDYEGSPLALMEYMAAGKPVVASNVGGVPDMIEHEVSGLLVPPRDPPRLAAAIHRLLRDEQGAAEMGGRGRVRQRQEFDIEVMVRTVERLYEDLYARKRGAELASRRS
jgi:glycosyltransferase involved in cell wall biosynthesis